MTTATPDASAPVNATQERRVCLKCQGPLTDDDLEMERGHCGQCRDMSRRVARWSLDEKLIAAYPDEYRDKELSLQGDIWNEVMALLPTVVNHSSFERDSKPQSRCELLVDWLTKRPSRTGIAICRTKNDVYSMTWEEVRSILRSEVERIEAEDQAKADGHQIGAAKRLESPSTNARVAIESANETASRESGGSIGLGTEVEQSPTNIIEPPYLGLSGINLEGEVRRKGYEKPADLSGKKVLRKLYMELLKVRDKPISHTKLARILKMNERALSSNIGRLEDELLIIDIEVSTGRNHMLVDCRDV